MLCKVRHGMGLCRCWVGKGAGGKVWVEVEGMEVVLTPGQFMVFYQAGVCLGAGVIAEGA